MRLYHITLLQLIPEEHRPEVDMAYSPNLLQQNATIVQKSVAVMALSVREQMAIGIIRVSVEALVAVEVTTVGAQVVRAMKSAAGAVVVILEIVPFLINACIVSNVLHLHLLRHTQSAPHLPAPMWQMPLTPGMATPASPISAHNPDNKREPRGSLVRIRKTTATCYLRPDG